ncbi:hypothetical protein F5X68DRAFT_272138 [Plectosphaerella plurivora]|uniref:Uncharacterized protein n=1 Tax=Plectosphaerella plurivora TaxID=936078 RepID=A0A9P9AGX3_9PEZI|nr:hypothetical protein F5X68DRAFT_272138 [Plectosphaerella plurivora]
MHHLHGIMAHGGHSLDGVLYGQGDLISILEDELSGGSHDVMRVLSLTSGQSMAVLSSSVCWLPADGSTPLSWTAMSPAGDVPELDILPENNLASGLSSPSVASPLTPTASISPHDSLRRDSAISFGHNDQFDDATGSNLQAPQPTNLSRFGPIPAQAYEPHGAMADKLDHAAHPQGEFLSMFNPNYSPWSSYPQDPTKASAMINPTSSDFQVNYMRVQSPYDYPSEAPHHERRTPPAQAAQPWTQPTAMSSYDWQGQMAHQYSDPVSTNQPPQSDIPRFHDSVSFPPDPRQQHFQMMDSLQSYDMSRAQGGPSQAPSPQDAVPQHHQPTFYRAPEQHTMNLTDANYHGAPTRPAQHSKPSKPHSSRNGRRPEPEPKPTPEEQALRPHVVLEYFRSNVKPDIDALEARQRELGDYPTDESRARLVSEALELVRPAVKNVTSALEALRPQYSQPWGGTQKRLQSDAEQILSMIQIIRRSALEESGVRQHEPRPASDTDAKPRKGLTALAQDYVDKAERVGRVTGHGARKEKTEAAQRAAATTNGRAQTMAYPSNGMAPVDWTQGQTTTPPPDHRSGPMGHYHHPQHMQQQHNMTASPATYAAMSGFSLHEPRPLLPTVSATPIADAAMATVMAPSGGPVGPGAWMAHHPTRVSAAGLGPAPLGYANTNTMYPSPPGYGGSSAQPMQHNPYAGVAPSPFPGHLQMGMPAGHDLAAGRRGSLPDRRNMARERAAPYSLAYRTHNERKGSV